MKKKPKDAFLDACDVFLAALALQNKRLHAELVADRARLAKAFDAETASQKRRNK